MSDEVVAVEAAVAEVEAIEERGPKVAYSVAIDPPAEKIPVCRVMPNGAVEITGNYSIEQAAAHTVRTMYKEGSTPEDVFVCLPDEKGAAVHLTCDGCLTFGPGFDGDNTAAVFWARVARELKAVKR